MTGVFIQARMGSKRLPGKALLTLSGFRVLEWTMAAMARVPADVLAVLTDEAGAASFVSICKKSGYELVVGESEDVLSRFVLAADRFGVTTIVRATADNPLLSWEMATASLSDHINYNSDYTTYLEMPVGTGVEIVRAEAIRSAHRETTSFYDREHVTPFLHARPDRFKCYTPVNPRSAEFGRRRVSLDTVDDYHRLLRIFHDLRPPAETLQPVAFSEVLSWLRNHDDAGENGKATARNGRNDGDGDY